MNWTKTPPTEPGKYYWKRCINSVVWFVRDLIDMGRLGLGDHGELLESIGGLWGGRVPAQGTTFTVKQIDKFLNTFSDYDEVSKVKEFLEYPVDGIAAVTAQHGKEEG